MVPHKATAAAMAPRDRRLYCAPSRTTAVSAGVYVGLQTGQLVAASCTEIIGKIINKSAPTCSNRVLSDQ